MTPSWGVMLLEAANVRALVDFPWLVSPAVAIGIVVLAINLLARDDERHTWVGLGRGRRELKIVCKSVTSLGSND